MSHFIPTVQTPLPDINNLGNNIWFHVRGRKNCHDEAGVGQNVCPLSLLVHIHSGQKRMKPVLSHGQDLELMGCQY